MDPLWTNDHREWYRTVYLQSEHWESLRASKLAANQVCERCPSRARDVHHIRYRNIFDVEIGDLLSLCRPCHEEEHRINGMPTRDKPRFKDDFDRQRHKTDQEHIRSYFTRLGRQQACEAHRDRAWTKAEKKQILAERRAKKFAKKYPMLARKLASR